MKAKIPPEAPLWVELGSTTPGEVSFEAKEPYSIAVVITNGKIRRKFVYINRRRMGIYVAHGRPGGFHESYHADGKRHWKFKGIDEETQKEEEFVIDLPSGPPLDQLTNLIGLHNATQSFLTMP
jgi:hypothetical protein